MIEHVALVSGVQAGAHPTVTATTPATFATHHLRLAWFCVRLPNELKTALHWVRI